jgi:hypothetical protein
VEAATVPCDEEGTIRLNLSTHTNVTLLDEAVGGTDGLRHPKTCHDDTKSPSTEGRDGNLPFDIAKLTLTASTCADYPHVVKILEKQVLVLPSEGRLWWKESKAMR